MSRHIKDSGTARQVAGQKAARSRLLRDIALYAFLPVVACWIIWGVLGGGIPWPVLPTLVALAWASAVYSRFNRVFGTVDSPAANRTTADVHREDATELPRVRFNDDGDLTDSFVRNLYELRNPEDEDNRES